LTLAARGDWYRHMCANCVHYGDALEVLKTLPPGIVQCCVTSPPYWGLRDYSVAGQFGLEKTIDEYIARMIETFIEVKRVLRDDGTVWLNLGDSYAGSGSPGGDFRDGKGGDSYLRPYNRKGCGLKPKDLCMIPARVALTLQANGWWLRSDIIWSKPNPMPESCTDRPTTAHEHLFLLSKRSRYFYDADAIREEAGPIKTAGENNNCDHPHTPDPRKKQDALGKNTYTGFNARWADSPRAGRNKRTVWEIPTTPYPGAHFATFPPKLVEPCILAGTSPRACEICGAPWKRVTAKGEPDEEWKASCGADSSGEYHGTAQKDYTTAGAENPSEVKARILEGMRKRETTGWQPTCSCDNEGKERCLVLDPFAGSGTTGEVALKHGRDYLLIELNRDYEELIRRRLGLFYNKGE